MQYEPPRKPIDRAPSRHERIVSLDQFRGYTVLGMFLVNFAGGFEVCHWLLKHHNTFCSYADTIMPQFFFAVGFAFRLTFHRRVEKDGAWAAYVRVIKRLVGLVLVALVIYSMDLQAGTWEQLAHGGFWQAVKGPLKSTWFQTLTHIAVTSLWILPVIRARALVRVAFMIASALLHIYISHQFYFHWVNNGQPNGVDGGPLGLLSWTIPMIVGTLACDAVAGRKDQASILRMIGWSLVLMGLGYVLSCGTRLYDVPKDQVETRARQKLAPRPVVPSTESLADARRRIDAGQWSGVLAEPPFVPPPHPQGRIDRSDRFRKWNYWMMSQRSGTVSYQTFAAGFSLALYALFYWCCDRFTLQLGMLRTLGTNALAAYVLHMMVDRAVTSFMPGDSPWWYMWTGLAVFLAIIYVFIRSLERSGAYLRL